MAPGAFLGYDIEVFVGLSRYLDYRQREEIRSGPESTANCAVNWHHIQLD